MKKKIVFLSISLIAYISVMFFLLNVLFSIPPSYAFQLTHSEIPKQITLGEQIEVTGYLTNNQFSINLLIYGSNLIDIFLLERDEDREFVNLKKDNADLIFMHGTKKETKIIKPEAKGSYTIFIVASFMIQNCEYQYSEYANIDVV